MKNTIKNYLMENLEEVQGIVAEINSYDGSLEHLDFLDMEDLDMYLDSYTPSAIAQRIFYGDFNPNHEYFKFNGYGNLESFDKYDVEEEYKKYLDEIIERLIDLYPNLYVSDELFNILTMDEEE